MILKVISSSSKGNLYAFVGEKETLIWEAGVSFMKLKQALNFDISKIVGCVISHVHSDHFGKAHEFLKSGIDVYTSKGTIDFSGIKHHRLHEVEPGSKFKLGDFTILAFSTVHDAPDPISFLINHPEMGNTLALTDTYYVEYTFRDLNNILLEVNYDEAILEENVRSGRVHESMRHRIITNHMGLGTAIDLLAANDLSKVQNIILIHLSDTNSDAKAFVDIVQKTTGKRVTVADKNTVISLNENPF